MKHIETIQKPCLKNSLAQQGKQRRARGQRGQAQPSVQPEVMIRFPDSSGNRIRFATGKGGGGIMRLRFFRVQGCKKYPCGYLTQEE